MKATTNVADFVKLVGEVMLVLLFLWTMFGSDQSIGNNLITYLTYAEPRYLQEYFSTVLTVASYAPGDLKVNAKISGIANTINITKDSKGYYIHVDIDPKKKAAAPFKGKVIFASPESSSPFLAGSCSIKETVVSLPSVGTTQTVPVVRNGKPCEIIIAGKSITQ